MKTNKVYMVCTDVIPEFENGNKLGYRVCIPISKQGVTGCEVGGDLALYDNYDDAQAWAEKMNAQHPEVSYYVKVQDIASKKRVKPRKIFLGPLL